MMIKMMSYILNLKGTFFWLIYFRNSAINRWNEILEKFWQKPYMTYKENTQEFDTIEKLYHD